MNAKIYTPFLSKRFFLTVVIALIAYSAEACYADYTYTNGCVGDTVFFYALDGYTAYTWDYGDTTSGSANISHDSVGYHVYTTPGDYYVTLFVNIGAEWDYRTNVIHISGNCFSADFQTVCGGSLLYYFNDYSTGSFTSQSWDFGDPASGVSDTSSDVAPYHFFTAIGDYTVTYIISDSIQSDTIVRVIHADTACLSVTIPNFTAALNCVGDTLIIYPSYGANVTYVQWNFGDTASGAANTSTDLDPAHQFSAPGFYIITLIYGDGTTFDTLTKGIPVVDCNVWPGDANMDGEVNGEDIFPLGIYYGNHGNQRNAPSNSWNGQSCVSWNNGSFNWMYLQDLVDMKMADCNGDGVIDNLDLQAIQANYGKRHTNHNNRSAMLFHSPTDPTLSVTPVTGAVNAGNDISFIVNLGSNAVPATDVYGCSFTLLFDPAKIDSGAAVTFTNAWFDTTGTHQIQFSHESYSEGRLELAFVKTDLISYTGNGVVATVTMHTKSSASGPLDIAIDGNAKIFNTNMYGGSGGNMEVFKNMYLQGTTATIENTSAVSTVTSNTTVSIFPNPSNGSLYIKHEKFDEPLALEMFNTLGERVFSKILTSAETDFVQLPEVANGLYQVSVKTIQGEIVGNNKIVLQR